MSMERLEITEAHKTLGVRLEPWGLFSEEFEFLQRKAGANIRKDSSYLACPRVGYLERVFHIFGYLKANPKRKVGFNPASIVIDQSRFHKHDWEDSLLSGCEGGNSRRHAEGAWTPDDDALLCRCKSRWQQVEPTIVDGDFDILQHGSRDIFQEVAEYGRDRYFRERVHCIEERSWVDRGVAVYKLLVFGVPVDVFNRTHAAPPIRYR